ncbi:hypothetical protein [Haloarcula pellucida]|uniref:Uncharacterized protein n=1 Tax=Haloarcula pellucida TaxID=1427151 RepID=A0A830GMQ4_9EURY|nr:hypothetical protein [Halomicroarcula pellucida]MBX0348235.1 hypothetical protein [Halomicroarcula pellucida]GGN97625.1 hypothetical protein GCM10009030_27050 [Halomicroarcula pellucida]
MAGLSASSGGGWDYIQADTPADPEKGESWYDTDGGSDGNGEAKVYDGTQWDVTGYISHDQLDNVSPADHHDPVTVTAPITRSGQALALAFGNALHVDANDDLAVDESAISHDNISDVSAADHHDPVTVSAPLTRSGQTLALALGNALTTDANDDLALALSSNLTSSGGVLDLSAPVSLGDGKITATPLEVYDAADDARYQLVNGDYNLTIRKRDGSGGFVAALRINGGSGTSVSGVDVVSGTLSEQGNRVATRNYTDSEITTHSGDADAHHSRPTGTQSATPSRSTNWNRQVDPDTSIPVTPPPYVETMDVESSGTSYGSEYVIVRGNGNQITGSVGATETKTITVDSFVREVQCPGSATASLQIKSVTESFPGHTHGI